jgi:hypothetical protein
MTGPNTPTSRGAAAAAGAGDVWLSAFELLDVPPVAAAAPRDLVAQLRTGLTDRETTVAVDDSTDEQVLAAFAEVVPDAQAHQRALGIPPEVTAGTLRDVRTKHRSFGARTEVPWLLRILRGDVLSMGRLQVERRPGPRGFALHIPALGPLASDAVDASLAHAHALLGADRFTCTSWLLDPALSAALPDTNMAAFARRFTLDPATTASTEAGTLSAAKFVFQRPVVEVMDPDRVTPHTRLERLVVQRLRDGGGWAEPTGTFALN